MYFFPWASAILLWHGLSYPFAAIPILKWKFSTKFPHLNVTEIVSDIKKSRMWKMMNDSIRLRQNASQSYINRFCFKLNHCRYGNFHQMMTVAFNKCISGMTTRAYKKLSWFHEATINFHWKTFSSRTPTHMTTFFNESSWMLCHYWKCEIKDFLILINSTGGCSAINYVLLLLEINLNLKIFRKFSNCFFKFVNWRV